MIGFVQGDMQGRVKDSFILLLLAEDAVQISGEILNISRIVAVPQAQCQLRFILNLLAQPDIDMPSVNNTI